jgi:hypothetical protein
MSLHKCSPTHAATGSDSASACVAVMVNCRTSFSSFQFSLRDPGRR